ncbi:MAG: hypothetical protein KC466_17150 [Myxococcales bacterium]|nr:hypothetical protein [Myxococcales bacterium]
MERRPLTDKRNVKALIHTIARRDPPPRESVREAGSAQCRAHRVDLRSPVDFALVGDVVVVSHRHWGTDTQIYLPAERIGVEAGPERWDGRFLRPLMGSMLALLAGLTFLYDRFNPEEVPAAAPLGAWMGIALLVSPIVMTALGLRRRSTVRVTARGDEGVAPSEVGIFWNEPRTREALRGFLDGVGAIGEKVDPEKRRLDGGYLREQKRWWPTLLWLTAIGVAAALHLPGYWGLPILALPALWYSYETLFSVWPPAVAGAWADYEWGRFDRAFERLMRFTERRPGHNGAWGAAALVLAHQRRYDGAERIAGWIEEEFGRDTDHLRSTIAQLRLLQERMGRSIP